MLILTDGSVLALACPRRHRSSRPTISGNVISLTGQSRNVDLTDTGAVAGTYGGYGNTDVQGYTKLEWK